jgi:hypothetical protein
MSYVLCRNGLKDVAGREALKCYFLPCYFVFEFQINTELPKNHKIWGIEKVLWKIMNVKLSMNGRDYGIIAEPAKGSKKNAAGLQMINGRD